MLESSKRYRVIKEGCIAAQEKRDRTGLASEQDRAIPVGTAFTLLDKIHWAPYSEILNEAGLNPDFYYVRLHSLPPGFVSDILKVQAHVLETHTKEAE
jgi:hypothetical protein